MKFKISSILLISVLMITKVDSMNILRTAAPQMPNDFDSKYSCSIAQRSQVGDKIFWQVANVWTGVGTNIGAAALHDGELLVAYYDRERWLTVASLQPTSGLLCSIRLPSRFEGWDAHNSVVLAVSSDGHLHVSGNAHASKLYYAYGLKSDIKSLVSASMIGKDEDRATYPTFLHNGVGDLFFMYRYGGSGDGFGVVNAWKNSTWNRVGLVFSNRDKGEHTSAYASKFVSDANGWMHVAVVWRKTPDVSTNYMVTYARTKDFKSWRRSDGSNFEGPLTPENGDVIEVTGPGVGLTNSPSITVSKAGAVTVFYNRHNRAGLDCVVAAKLIGHTWTIKEIANSQGSTLVSGFGALPALPKATIDILSDNEVRMALFFPPREHRDIAVDLVKLSVRDIPSDRHIETPTSAMFKADLKKMSSVVRRVQTVSENGVDGPAHGRLYWYAQSANFDRPRACTPENPLACNPPASPLYWSPD